MRLDPGYGETPVDPEDLDALTEQARELVGDAPTKTDLYDLEQAISNEVAGALIEQIIDGTLGLDELLADHFLRDLHGRLYGDIWTWAGRFRTRELNLGVAPEQIAVELRSSLDTIRWRWEHTSDWTARVLGVAVHAETVRVHPFVDGNGRSTRLLADLVFFAAQPDDAPIEEYDWVIDKGEVHDPPCGMVTASASASASDPATLKRPVATSRCSSRPAAGRRVQDCPAS